eukprot:CAMPEP_0182419280 /NCGR_PEP_ID=MMETSP1167-20130531/3731_1 /TAXON_ID=2988 /ORGANISM="Mallomonas Sp, Strain CCMP3275" /LENGTH=95 /DNA_ID=CAMNT_0024594081 /DNA_START=89 /DNA_END=376 /DNA_ORIENTATION=-
MFGGSDAQRATGPTPLFAAKTEMEMYSDLFSRMNMMCFDKCIVRYNEPDLAVGEMMCVDRCVGKYLEGQEQVGAKLKEIEAKLKAEQMALKGLKG